MKKNATAATVHDLVGRRVHIWQPLPLTSRAHYYGTLTALTGQQGGLPILHLTDVEVKRGGATQAARDRKMAWSLNWSIEPV